MYFVYVVLYQMFFLYAFFFFTFSSFTTGINLCVSGSLSVFSPVRIIHHIQNWIFFFCGEKGNALWEEVSKRKHFMSSL